MHTAGVIDDDDFGCKIDAFGGGGATVVCAVTVDVIAAILTWSPDMIYTAHFTTCECRWTHRIKRECFLFVEGKHREGSNGLLVSF